MANSARPDGHLLVPAGDGLRRNNFNTLRLFAALLVVWSHSFALWFATEAGEPLSRLMNGVYNAGNIAVLVFFTISGFLISLSYQRSASWRSYLRKRVARIYPGYLVATLLCSLLFAPLLSQRPFGSLSGSEALGLASNLLLRNYIVPTPGFDGAVNGSLWSIAYEFWCYLGVIAMAVLGFYRPRLLIPLAALAVELVRTWLDATGRRPGAGLIPLIIGFPYFWFMVLPSFLIGAAFFRCRDVVPRSPTLLAALLLATVASAWIPLPGGFAGAITRLLVPPVLGYAIFFVAFHPRLRLPDAARYGDFSYGCYLYAFPLQQVLVMLFRREGLDRAFGLYLAASLVSATLAGVASWYAVERWFEAGRLRRSRRPLEPETLLVAQ